MQGIYEFSSSDRVKRFEEDLSKELKQLQNAIEENDFLKVTSSNPQKSFRYVWSRKECLLSYVCLHLAVVYIYRLLVANYILVLNYVCERIHILCKL